MTTQREMAAAYFAQQQVIIALYSIGDPDMADRLDRCMIARRDRHNGDGWPYTCRSAACTWCRGSLVRGWWRGMRQWPTETVSSLAILQVHPSPSLGDAVRRLRRSLRDVRDRMARHSERWRDVCLAGLVGGDGVALVLVSHAGLDRGEVLDALCRRWPDVEVKGLEQEEPTVAMSPGDAADLGETHRGIEPLRVVIMPQRDPRLRRRPEL